MAPRISTPKEQVLHLSVAKLLSEHGCGGWMWFHPANGELRDIRTAAKLKAMGVKPGVPDFVIVEPNGTVRFLELKREGAVLTRSQEEFRLWCVKHDIAYSIAWTIDEVLAILEEWGCIRVKRNSLHVESSA